MSQDFHVTVKVRNGRIIRRMRELGIDTFAELKRQMGRRQEDSRLGDLVNFKTSPLAKKGEHACEWSTTAMDLSAALHIEPEELWPEQLKRLKARNGEVAFYADEADLKRLPSNDSIVDPKALRMLLDSLTNREMSIIKRRFVDNMTLEEVGLEENVNRERIRQIESKAIRKMHHRANVLKLKRIEDMSAQ